jgi:hypothetical protein
MLYHCEFTWHAGTSTEEVWQRVLQQHDAGQNHPERIRGWYSLAGGGAGFLLVEYDDPRELSRFLTPYMDLLSFDVRAIYETKYDEAIRRAQQEYGVGTGGTPAAGSTKFPPS